MSFLFGSLRIGTLFGIEIRVHGLFVLWIVYRLLSHPAQWQYTALNLGLLFSIVLLHELGHCFGARAVGGEARQILMWPLGGLAYASAPARPWPQFVTVVSGPAVNVLICLVAGLALYLTVPVAFGFSPLGPTAVLGHRAPAWALYLAHIYDVSFFLLAFNLLPIYPLDGGQIAQTVLWPFLGLRRSTILACYVGLAGCVGLGLLALRGGGGILLFIALFGGMVCWQRLRAAQLGLLVEDFAGPGYDRPRPRRRFFWRWRRKPDSGGAVFNPNPGGWEAQRAERERLEAEVDRILKKVSERGLHSLSYVERQTLERARRLREQEEGR
jgi:Zn-dependent protease